MGRGVEERVVVDVEDGEESAAAGSSRETRMLPMAPVRVLLAEGDDSTRHIISALLRKCGYQVTAASDGVKAWDLLKEKSFKIDLVLSEVELPLMSGFFLLSTIMEHDACKNIPVIMMSSNDSVSMVFKCMLKGAADFLVKPLRKNELRNLWQHVWRKQLATTGLDAQHTQENLTERHEQKTEATKAEHVTENVSQRNMECSEQESDAQSSCTRSELEAESKHTNNVLEFKQLTGRRFSTPDHKSAANQIINDDKMVPPREDDVPPRRTFLNDNKCEKVSRDTELAHIIDNQQKNTTPMEMDVTRTNYNVNDGKCFSIPAHQLELSLRRSDYSKLENREENERRTLKHSTSSAFSLYNCKTASSFGNAGDAQTCSTSTTHADLENKNGDSIAPSQHNRETNHPPIRVVPVPVPVGGLTFDGQPFWSGAPVTSLFYPNSAPPVWNSKTSMCQDATTQSTSSQQNGPQDMDREQFETEEEQTLNHPNAKRKHLLIEIPTDESRRVSSMTGESGSSTVLDSARNTLSGSGCDSSSNQINDPTESSNTFKDVPENPEGLRHLSQREVALNKFRLKRKDRCFEKKVRYQSRKLLAEQRPRVKGQFVRQDQSVQGS